MIDRKRFFDAVRKTPFHGKLTAGQTGGMEAILSEWERRKLTDLRWLAYMLATTFHETAHTMQPIAEIGKGKGRKYGVPAGPYKQVYYGRGFVQLTWLENYERAAKAVGVDLVRYPDEALRTDIAAKVMFDGMTEGWFAGDKSGRHKLSRYFNDKVTDWAEARRIINGTDKAATIAGYGRAFHEALVSALTAPTPIPSNPVLRKGDGIKDDGFRSVVMEAQRLLTDAGFSLVVDGKFGLVTEAKVIAFQKVRGLVPDGIIGPKTWAELRRIAAEPLSTFAVMGIGEPETEPQPKETTMSIVSGKQKAWMALVMPAVVTAVITGLDMFGVKIDPTIQTGAIMILTALGVYQVPNKGA